MDKTWIKDTDTVLTREGMRDLFGDGDSRYWISGPVYGDRNLVAIFEVLDGKTGAVTVRVENESGDGSIDSEGTFDLEGFKKAIIDAAVTRFL